MHKNMANQMLNSGRLSCSVWHLHRNHFWCSHFFFIVFFRVLFMRFAAVDAHRTLCFPNFTLVVKYVNSFVDNMSQTIKYCCCRCQTLFICICILYCATRRFLSRERMTQTNVFVILNIYFIQMKIVPNNKFRLTHTHHHCHQNKNTEQ